MAITIRQFEIERLIRFYRKAIRDLAHQFASEIDFTRARSFAQLQASLNILRELDGKTERWAKRNIRKLYLAASDEAQKDLKKLGIKRIDIENVRAFALVNERAVQALLVDPQVGFVSGMRQGIQQIKNRMRSIQRQAKLLSSQQRLFDQTIARVGFLQGQNLATVRNKIVDEIVKMKNINELEFTSKAKRLPPGHIVKDVANLPFVKIPTVSSSSGFRRLRVDKYAELLARTKTGQAVSLARRNKSLEFGANLMQISGNKPLEDDACFLYIGKAFALTESAREEFGVPLVQELPNGGAPFHPNCTHTELIFPIQFKSKKQIDQAFIRPPEWALNRPWSEVSKEFIRGGGAKAIKQTGHTTGGRERRRREQGLSPDTEGSRS